MTPTFYFYILKKQRMSDFFFPLVIFFFNQGSLRHQSEIKAIEWAGS